MKKYFREFASYSAWANRRLFMAIPEQFLTGVATVPSGDSEVSVDEVADGAESGLALDAGRAGDGSISGMDLSALA
jgi:hypothetical protein